MAGRGRGKYWSISLLKRRGWTNELVRELLPAPRWLPVEGHSVRVWAKEDVRRAEDSPQFLQGRAGQRGSGEPARISSAGGKAACAAVSELPHRCFPAVPAAAPLPA